MSPQLESCLTAKRFLVFDAWALSQNLQLLVGILG
jgi:hypothetical protein